jgi:hypothetical protein
MHARTGLALAARFGVLFQGAQARTGLSYGFDGLARRQGHVGKLTDRLGGPNRPIGRYKLERFLPGRFNRIKGHGRSPVSPSEACPGFDATWLSRSRYS